MVTAVAIHPAKSTTFHCRSSEILVLACDGLFERNSNQARRDNIVVFKDHIMDFKHPNAPKLGASHDISVTE